MGNVADCISYFVRRLFYTFKYSLILFNTSKCNRLIVENLINYFLIFQLFSVIYELNLPLNYFMLYINLYIYSIYIHFIYVHMYHKNLYVHNDKLSIKAHIIPITWLRVQLEPNVTGLR